MNTDDAVPCPTPLCQPSGRTELTSATAREGREPGQVWDRRAALKPGARTRGPAPANHDVNDHLCHQLPGSEGAGQSDNL